MKLPVKFSISILQLMPNAMRYLLNAIYYVDKTASSSTVQCCHIISKGFHVIKSKFPQSGTAVKILIRLRLRSRYIES